MLSALPKLLDRNFLIGYFFPSILFVGLSYHIIRRFSEFAWFKAVAASDLVTRTSILSVVAGGIALILALSNTFLIRRLEGYGWPFDQLSILSRRQITQYRKLKSIVNELEDNWDTISAKGGSELGNARAKRDKARRNLFLYFPDDERFILPTSFGNIIRAFEVYPRVAYGLDGIPGWHRLIGVIPENYLKHTLDAKAKLDFCINSFYLILAFIFVMMLCLTASRHPVILIACSFAALMLMFISWVSAKQAALSWGAFIRSCFDLYIDELAAQLGYSPPLSKERWTDISIAFLYPDELPPKPRRSQIKK